MKPRIAFSFILLLAFASCRKENSNPVVIEPPNLDQVVRGIVDQTNLDSLTTSASQLSGASLVTLNGITDTITCRYPTQKGHALAITYLTQKLASYGLIARADSFNTTAPLLFKRGVNITARKQGTEFPQYVYIISAHYDDVPFVIAPGADDDGSGTAAVLEAARILANYQTKYTILFALWDEEEQGSGGSSYYVSNIAASGDSMMGVVNMDMIGYDSNDDGKMDIHTTNIARSVDLADTLVYIIHKYELALTPIIYNPGASNSDNGPFWSKGYSAIVFSEAYYGGDFNPHYHGHSGQDKIDYFNFKFFLNCSKLAIATISTLAVASSK